MTSAQGACQQPLSHPFPLACQELLMLSKTHGKRSLLHVYVQGRMRAYPQPGCCSVLWSLSQNNADSIEANFWWLIISWVRLFPILVLYCISLSSMMFWYLRNQNQVENRNGQPKNGGVRSHAWSQSWWVVSESWYKLCEEQCVSSDHFPSKCHVTAVLSSMMESNRN